ncbi:hypothetical protein ACS0TY_011520 [Phlomoides rotata]
MELGNAVEEIEVDLGSQIIDEETPHTTHNESRVYIEKIPKRVARSSKKNANKIWVAISAQIGL